MDAEAQDKTRSLLRAICTAVGFACVLRLFMDGQRLFRIESLTHEASLLLYAFFVVAQLVLLLILTLSSEKVDGFFGAGRTRFALVSISCAILYWATVVITGPMVQAEPLVNVVVTLTYAFSLVVCYYSWGYALFSLEQTHALVAVAAMPAILAASQVVAEALPFGPLEITGAMAIAMAVCACAVPGFPPAREGHLDLKDARLMATPAFVVALCGIYACALASGVLALDELDRATMGDRLMTLALSVVAGGSLAYCALPSVNRQRLNAAVQLICTLLVIFVLFIAIGFALLESSSRLPTNLLEVARRFCIVCCLITIMRSEKLSGISPTKVFSLFGIVGVVIPQIIRGPMTPVVNDVVNSALLQNKEIVILAISGLLILVTFLLLVPLKEPEGTATSGGGEGSEGPDGQGGPKGAEESRAPDMEAVYRAVASDYGLTPREQEVMQLIAEGNSMRKVGETLFISLGTVQSHAKKIYKKMDVHSRQDLLDIVNRYLKAYTD